MEETQIVEAQPTNQLLPVADHEQAKEAYQAYLELCQSILIPYDERLVDDKGVVRQESDYARIPQKRNVSGRWVTEYVDAPRKSAWRKLARFYGVSTEIVDKTREEKDNEITWHYTVRAWQGDVTTMGEGSCSTREKNRDLSEHDARATAHTRAKNRAISDLIGFGQVSAEELTPESGEEKKPERNPTNPRRKVPSQQKKPKEKQQPQKKSESDLYTKLQGIIETLPVGFQGVLQISEFDNKIYVQHGLGFPEEDKEKVAKALAPLKPKYVKDSMYWEVHK